MNQPQVLDYARPTIRSVPWWLTGLLAILLTLGHVVYSHYMGYWLFALSGGVHHSGFWTEYGGINFAWTLLPWFLGPIIGPLSLLLMLAGSIASGTILSSVLLRPAFRVHPVFGRCYWRLWAVLGGWVIWFPVPLKLSEVYWWTVYY